MGRNPKYDDEFKRNAVMLVKTSGKSPKAVAEDLGISDNSMYKWIKQGFGGKDTKSEIDELTRLRKENADLRMERDILKKAMGYFAKNP